MSQPNPYESPQTEQPLKPRQIVKRGMGLATILWLTPLAVGIAFAGSCAATSVTIMSLKSHSLSVEAMFLVGWSVFLVPPIITYVAMMWWARRASLRDAKQPKTNLGEDRG
jgi:hypothetical protein